MRRLVMLNLDEANSIITNAYPNSEIMAIVETPNYYIYNLSTSRLELKEAVNKNDGKIELLNSLIVKAEARENYVIIKGDE